MTSMDYMTALDTIIERTEIGYTIASQDRLWIVFTFDLESENAFRYNRLYPAGYRRWAYDLDIYGVEVWTTRREAEKYAAELRELLAAEPFSPEGERPQVYVMNLGDDARYEDAHLGGYKRARREPKFAGSREAWKACEEMQVRWREHFARLSEA